MCLPFVNSVDEFIVAAEENTVNKAHGVSYYTLWTLVVLQNVLLEGERIMDVEK